MTSQPHLKFAVLIMAVLLITGIVCYAAFSPPEPADPVRIMFQNDAGKVLFTHQTHTEGYYLDCLDCHHNLDDDETYNCSDCHEETGDDYMPSRTDSLHETCIGCHADYGAGPVDCNACHVL